MVITLIRHLPTEWNKKKMLQGRKDIDISANSEENQAGIKQNQQWLQEIAPFEIVLASTLKRTQQTARLYGFGPEIEGLLDELDFGPFEGVPREKLIEMYGAQWVENPRELILGERIVNLENRVVSFLDKYQCYSNILVFGHGSWMRALVSYYQNGDINKMNKITIQNNECITLRFSNQK